MTLPGVLRGALLVLLAAAAVWVPERGPASARPGVLRLPTEANASTGTPPRLVVRASPEPPGAAEMDALAALSTPLVAALPAHPVGVELVPPSRPVAGRAAAVAFRVRGAPGSPVAVRLVDETGVLDSVRVRLDSAGVAAGSFRVRPARPGWRSWRAEAGGERAWTAAWVAPPRPLRLRVVAGPPGWESKFVVRALEESGAVVSLSQPLGRGLAIRSEDATVADVVVLLEGASLDGSGAAALAGWVADGGGVLGVGGVAARGPLRVTTGGGGTGEPRADALRWTLPAELVPLPALPLRSAAVRLGAPLPGAVVAAAGADGPVLVLRPSGRGRVATLGLTETWRWRMEGGEAEAHRAFWRGLAEWLAAGSSPGVQIRPVSPDGPLGEAVAVRVFARGDGEPAPLRLVRPSGATETLPLRPDPARPGVLVGRFVPVHAGLHTLAYGDAEPAAGFQARQGATAALPWARLALLAHRSGGAALPATALPSEIARRAPATADDTPADPRPWLFAALLLLATAEWTFRRLRGRP